MVQNYVVDSRRPWRRRSTAVITRGFNDDRFRRSSSISERVWRTVPTGALYNAEVCDRCVRVRSTPRLTYSSTRGSSPHHGSASTTEETTRSASEHITLKPSRNSVKLLYSTHVIPCNDNRLLCAVAAGYEQKPLHSVTDNYKYVVVNVLALCILLQYFQFDYILSLTY